MNNTPKVSVIMPSLNVGPYIRECIESVVNQTLKDIEIICVDAGSTDGTLEVLEEYAAKDDRITVLRSDKKSYGYQMNMGIDAAKGEYIGIVETDDYIEPDMYETLYQVAEANALDIVKADFTRFVDKEDGTRSFNCANIAEADHYDTVLDLSEIMSFFVSTRSIYSWAGIYNTGFLRSHNIRHNETPGASYQDNGFWFQSFTQAHRAMFVHKAFYNLRRDNPNSSIRSKGKVFCMCEEYDFIRRFLRERPELEERFAPLAAYYRMCNYDFTLNRIAPEFKLEFLQRYSEDFRMIEENGELRTSLYPPQRWNKLRDIMECPEYVYYRDYYKDGKLRKELEQARKRADMLSGELNGVHASLSYRIGRVITWLPRKIRGGILCLKEHGPRYTFERLLIHLHLKANPEKAPKKGNAYYSTLSPRQYPKELKQ